MEATKRNSNYKYMRDVKEHAGNVCVNCGTSENIEYHHIVPLLLGGQERLSNVVALCHKCHLAAHHGRHISEYKSVKSNGRKPNVPDREAIEAFNLFLNAEIGQKKCKQMAGLSDGTKLKDNTRFMRYLESKNIENVKNNIDVIATNSELKDGDIVGEIKYKNGSVKILRYSNTGKNDVVYKHREQKIRVKIFKTD